MLLKQEKYFIILNGNSELLKLNEFLKNVGFEFIKVKPSDLEGKSDFLRLKPKQRPIDDKYWFLLASEVDVELGAALDDDSNDIFLLKEKNKTWRVVEEREGFSSWTEIDVEVNDMMSILDYDVFKPEEKLISKVNLFLDGDIHAIFEFALNAETRELTNCKFLRKHNKIGFEIKLVDEKLEPFEYIIRANFKFPEMLNLAVSAYEEYELISNNKLAYVNLFLGIESIFNRSSSEPIQHILSRHAALLLSKDEKQFDRIYKRIKELYSVRSSIVHGESDKKKLKKLKTEFKQSLIDARHLLKQVIRELLWQSFTTSSALDKEELFKKLNQKGV